MTASASVLATVAVFSLTGPVSSALQAQAQAGPIPRLPGTKVPNMGGVWQALNEANWNLEPHAARAARTLHPGLPGHDPVPHGPELALGATAGIPGGFGVVEGGTIPYKPDALKKRNENAQHSLARDPEVKCLVPGVPRATYMPYPFQLTQSHTKVMLQYGFSNAGRTIHLDDVDDPGLETWMGHSVGRWEGDTLVVNVNGLNDQTWFDRAGNFHSAAMKVTERYTMISSSHIRYEATIDDPETFTRPWTIRMPLYKRIEDNARVFEFRCIQWTEELVYGHLRKKQLVTSWRDDYGRRGGTLGIQITRRPTRIEE
jgi:hypothetical protein